MIMIKCRIWFKICQLTCKICKILVCRQTCKKVCKKYTENRQNLNKYVKYEKYALTTCEICHFKRIHLESWPHGINMYIHVSSMNVQAMYSAYRQRLTDMVYTNMKTHVHVWNMYTQFCKCMYTYVHGMYKGSSKRVSCTSFKHVCTRL